MVRTAPAFILPLVPKLHLGTPLSAKLCFASPARSLTQPVLSLLQVLSLSKGRTGHFPPCGIPPSRRDEPRIGRQFTACATAPTSQVPSGRKRSPLVPTAALNSRSPGKNPPARGNRHKPSSSPRTRKASPKCPRDSRNRTTPAYPRSCRTSGTFSPAKHDFPFPAGRNACVATTHFSAMHPRPPTGMHRLLLHFFSAHIYVFPLVPQVALGNAISREVALPAPLVPSAPSLSTASPHTRASVV